MTDVGNLYADVRLPVVGSLPQVSWTGSVMEGMPRLFGKAVK